MDKTAFLKILKDRFNKHEYRHRGVIWDIVEAKLTSNETILNTLFKMEETKGEPDLVIIDSEMLYVDFSKETPKGRTSICYDQKARLSRKKLAPESSALEMAEEIGISVLDEKLYQAIQKIEELDLKTSSWLKTADDIRSLGGAIFGDRRYQRTFIYHNGADSYYGSRGFRGYIYLK